MNLILWWKGIDIKYMKASQRVINSLKEIKQINRKKVICGGRRGKASLRR